MQKIILHIPHSSDFIPIQEGYVAGDNQIEAEIFKLTDWYTDDLFNSGDLIRIIAPFSRLFCDVERFPDDQDEPMARLGMGMTYTKLDNGKSLRNVSPRLREIIKKEYYDVHHNKLSSVVSEQLEINNTSLIIDCHSFSNKPFLRDICQTIPRPDICIGTDDFHTPKELAELALNYFKEAGYDCKLNSPYSGTMVPSAYYKKDNRVQSLMIEVNRDLYLVPGTNKKSSDYKKIKSVIADFLEYLATNYC